MKGTRWIIVLSISIGAVIYFSLQHSTAKTPLLSAATAPVAESVQFQNLGNHHHYDRQLRASMRIFQQRTGIQIGILLLDKLPLSTTIESYAAEAFTKLKLGQSNNNKGLLYIWAESEHQFKIEVSYELEGVFPDALCHRLETGARTFMLSSAPYAQRDFLAELMVTMGMHYLDYRDKGQTSDLIMPSAAPGYLSSYLSGGAGIVGRGYAATLEQINKELTPLTKPLINEMQPDAVIDTVIQRYLKSLEMGIGDPYLPLLTDGSNYFRMEKPHAPGYLQRVYRYMVDAMPYRIIEQGDFAVALFKPGHPVLPVVLRKNKQGIWFVDEPGAWAEFQLSDDGRMIPKYSESTYSFATANEQASNKIISLYQNRAKVTPLSTYNADLKERVKNAEMQISKYPDQAATYIKLAEILHYEMFWLRSAAPLYEKALELNPGRTDLHWRLIDLYRNMEEIDEEEKHYKTILRLDPNDALARYYLGWLKNTFK